MIKEIMFKWQDLEAKYMDKSWQYAEGEERGLEKGRAEGRAEGIFNLISCNEIQDMLMLQKGINWNDLPTDQKRGSCAIKQEYLAEDGGYRTHWVIDKEIPIFKGDVRDYIEDLICIGEV